MSVTDDSGITTMKVHPDYLESNSTSHTWAFGAFAELIDNSYDAKAKEIHIDQTVINGIRCLSFHDDGLGMDRVQLNKMLGLGYHDKDLRNPVGMYGNGFKSGAMRLGKDAIVFTRTKESAGIGFLSQTYLKAINADIVQIPMLHYSFPVVCIEDKNREKNLKAILEHSPFKEEKALLQQLKALDGTGTIIVIYNLRKIDRYDRIELDFTKDPSDIRCPEGLEDQIDTQSHKNSLREYCSILFLHPRMKIKLRGSYVKTRLIDKSLKNRQIDDYKPKAEIKGYKITFGQIKSGTSEEYGMMLYRENRLIKPYEKVTCQKQNDGTGVGIVGVTDASFLTPIHNKQDFLRNEKFNSAMISYSMKLKNYWNYVTDMSLSPSKSARDCLDIDWVQCENKDCLKWRRLPYGFDMTSLPDKWYCHFHPNNINCSFPEDVHLADEEIKRSTKKIRSLYKRKSDDGQGPSQLKSKQSKLEKSASPPDPEKAGCSSLDSGVEGKQFIFHPRSTSNFSILSPIDQIASNSSTKQTVTLASSKTPEKQHSILPDKNKETSSHKNDKNSFKTKATKFMQNCANDKNTRNQMNASKFSFIKREDECPVSIHEPYVFVPQENKVVMSEMIENIEKEEENIIEMRTRSAEEKNKELAETKTKLDEKKKEIVEMKTKLEEKNKEIAEMKIKLDEEHSYQIFEATASLFKKFKSIEEMKNNEIAEMKTRLHEQSKEIAKMKERLDEKSNEIAKIRSSDEMRKNKEIAEMRADGMQKIKKEISEMKTRFDKKSKDIAEMRTRLDDEKNKEITEMRTRLDKEKNNEITEVRTRLDERKNQEIAEMRTRLDTEKNNEITEVRTRLDERKNQEIAEMRTRLDTEKNNEITEVRTRLDERKNQEIAEMRTRLDTEKNNEITEVRTRLHERKNQEIAEMRTRLDEQNIEITELRTKLNEKNGKHGFF